MLHFIPHPSARLKPRHTICSNGGYWALAAELKFFCRPWFPTCGSPFLRPPGIGFLMNLKVVPCLNNRHRVDGFPSPTKGQRRVKIRPPCILSNVRSPRWHHKRFFWNKTLRLKSACGRRMQSVCLIICGVWTTRFSLTRTHFRDVIGTCLFPCSKIPIRLCAKNPWQLIWATSKIRPH